MKSQQDSKPDSTGQGRMNNTGKNAARLFILPLLLLFCILFYYFGELVDWASWNALRNSFFYSVHDIHRLLFLIPIIYAGYIYGTRATIIVTIIALMTFLPRALFISPYPDPLLRMILFTVISGTMGYLVAMVRRETERRSHLEVRLRNERNKLMDILERMEDGVMIIAPDYRIRFMNSSMTRDFGANTDSFCYRLLHGRDEPCQGICRLPAVLEGSVERWNYEFPDGRTYEVHASSYKDSDGVTCQLTSFRNITHRS